MSVFLSVFTGRYPVTLPEDSVKMPHAAEADLFGDMDDRQIRRIQQTARKIQFDLLKNFIGRL